MPKDKIEFPDFHNSQLLFFLSLPLLFLEETVFKVLSI